MIDENSVEYQKDYDKAVEWFEDLPLEVQTEQMGWWILSWYHTEMRQKAEKKRSKK